ncbi:MAG: hypothetical protein M1823_005769 [Watsoniomyces obsoletus]|nr:MAG: hypothetical protein M1823_005769 [Watsoniomyces obsoletus]
MRHLLFYFLALWATVSWAQPLGQSDSSKQRAAAEKPDDDFERRSLIAGVLALIGVSSLIKLTEPPRPNQPSSTAQPSQPLTNNQLEKQLKKARERNAEILAYLDEHKNDERMREAWDYHKQLLNDVEKCVMERLHLPAGQQINAKKRVPEQGSLNMQYELECQVIATELIEKRINGESKTAGSVQEVRNKTPDPPTVNNLNEARIAADDFMRNSWQGANNAWKSGVFSPRRLAINPAAIRSLATKASRMKFPALI